MSTDKNVVPLLRDAIEPAHRPSTVALLPVDVDAYFDRIAEVRPLIVRRLRER